VKGVKNMRPPVKQFVKMCSENLPVVGPIYEFGSFQVPGHKGYADLRPFFPNREFIGADIRSGDGVDVIMDVTDTGLPSESVGTVLMLDTLEHVEYLRQAMHEVYRILKPDGILIMSSVMFCPIHDNHDYWRFTPEGFKSLLKPFTFSSVDYIGTQNFPHTVLGIASKSFIKDIAELRCNE
jgi:SAM-dependent methyltransferase